MGLVRGRNVTVAIPSIPGREELLGRALDSVQAQTVAPQRVLVHTDVERHGAAWARNQLLRRIRTGWVAWLDDDDELLPDHLEVLIRGANDSRADLIYSNPEWSACRTRWRSATTTATWCRPDRHPVRPAQEQWLRERGNFIPVRYLVRTALLKQVGGFPEPHSVPVPAGNNSGGCEDSLALLKLLDAGARFHHVLGVRTWRYHVWGGNVGGRGQDRIHEIQP
jgi:hypothetical protein